MTCGKTSARHSRNHDRDPPFFAVASPYRPCLTRVRRNRAIRPHDARLRWPGGANRRRGRRCLCGIRSTFQRDSGRSANWPKKHRGNPHRSIRAFVAGGSESPVCQCETMVEPVVFLENLTNSRKFGGCNMRPRLDKKTAIYLYCHLRQAERSIHHVLASRSQWPTLLDFYDQVARDRLHFLIGCLRSLGAREQSGLSRETVFRLSLGRSAVGA
jgi:hypothetical protein